MDDPPPNGVAARLGYIEERLAKIERLEPAVLAERIANHHADMNAVRDEIRSLRRALYTFAFSVAAAAVVFAIGVLQVMR